MTRSPLEVWSRWNAAALLATGTVAALSGSSAPFVAVALASTAVLLARTRGLYTPSGRFGVANTVTLVRLLGVLSLPALAPTTLGVGVLSILALDGVDGFLARRSGSCSEFGAHFDMETDAMLVAMCTLQLFTRGGLGGWVLFAGALRYVYVVCLWLVPARGGNEPRSLLGRIAFLAFVLGLAAPWLLGRSLGVGFAALGSSIVTLSFARSFYYSYRTR